MNLEKAANIETKDNLAKTVKAVGGEPIARPVESGGCSGRERQEPLLDGLQLRVELFGKLLRTELAKHKRVVAYRSFLRTLLHEICHHLDYEHFRFPETFHTEGFYNRESALVRRCERDPLSRPGARRPRRSAPPDRTPWPGRSPSAAGAARRAARTSARWRI